MTNQSRQNDFPILQQKVNGHPLIYFDNTNTSLTPIQVVQKMDEYYEAYNANIHRAVYSLSERATTEYENAREKIRAFINARSTKEIVFTRNATESINLVAQTWGRTNLKEGDTVILSIMEHHSNIVPWQLLQKEKGFHLRYLSLTEEGRLNLEAYERILKTEKVKLVSLIHQSNVLGTMNPSEQLAQLAHQHGAKILIDGAQSVPHMKVDVQAIDADFFVFTGHKMCGPTGIGVLHAKEELLHEMPPFMGGGDMIRSVQITGSEWNDLPYKFEAGTPNIAGAIGLGAAVDYLNSIGMEHIHEKEQELLSHALKMMKEIPQLTIHGPLNEKDRGAIISFSLSGIHPHDLATILGEKGICVRAGNHCAQPLMEFLNVPATTRISFYFYNTKEEIDAFIQELQSAQSMFL
ncbi:MAG: cysteine desulfurase [Candidatus Altimarinota bacterium]